MIADLRRELLVRLLKLLDLCALSGAFVVALAICSGSLSWRRLNEVFIIRVAVSNALIFAGYLLVCSFIFSACRLYESHRLSNWSNRLREVASAALLCAGTLVAMRRIFDLSFATDSFLLLFACLSGCSLFVIREWLRLVLHLVRLRGRNLRNVVVIAEEPED